MAKYMEKANCFFTQHYDVPYGRVSNRFVATLSVELDVIWNQRYNAERMIFFQTVVLKPVRLVSVLRNICDRISSRFDLWNRGAYQKLVQDSYRAVGFF